MRNARVLLIIEVRNGRSSGKMIFPDIRRVQSAMWGDCCNFKKILSRVRVFGRQRAPLQKAITASVTLVSAGSLYTRGLLPFPCASWEEEEEVGW